MGLLTRILGNEENDVEPPNTVDELIAALEQRNSTLNLHATFGEPQFNSSGEETAVFPCTLLDQNNEFYGMDEKEFFIPDDGLYDADSALTQFVAACADSDPTEVTTADLREVEGTTFGVELNENGDMELL